MTGTWREAARRTIHRVAAEAKRDNPAITEPELRKMISDAYPFGPRQYHPYKMWLSEVKAFFASPETRKDRPPVIEKLNDLPMFQEE